MSVLDWILVAIRWGHALAAVAWVGGGMFYVLVLRPSFQQTPPPAATSRAIGVEFRGLVSTAIAVLLVTGTVVSVSRLASDRVTSSYVAVLVIKIALALYMFYIVRFLRRGAYPEEPGPRPGWPSRWLGRLTNTTAVLITGVVVFGLSDLLDQIYENAATD